MKAAQIYPRFGWRVLPVAPNSKVPMLQDWPNRASNDPATIARWQEEHPTANVGIATGAGSGIIVLDIDPRNGGRIPEGLPKTVQAATPSGGYHFFFKHPGGRVANSVGKIGPGIDLRADGGQVVVAPSRTPSGSYRWINPPWDTPLAECPARLLATPEAKRVPIPDSNPITSGAREALERHGPAVEGKGGDLHTFRAAALLVNDWALTEDEAWPLILEWNADCQPPWSESELRAKLRGGAKYASRPPGCARPFNAVEAAKRELLAWQEAGRNEGDLTAHMARIREIVARCDDTVTKALIAQEIISLTGLKHRDLSLPRVQRPPVDVKRGEILVTTELHRVADEAIKAIAPLAYQRGGVLCEVVTGDQTYIHDLDSARIQDLMSRCATYIRTDETQGTITMAPPERVASILQSRREHPVRQIEAVTTAPIFLADGAILSERGYNAQARVYLEPSVEVYVPENPTLEDAQVAVETLCDLVCDFKFFSEADRSAWLAGLISPLVKSATGNAPAPLFCVSASSPGAGKTLLTDLIARIVTGGAAEIRSYGTKDPGEWVKKLTSFVKAGSPVSVFDNVNGAIGDENLDRLITSATWSDRILGASDAPPLPNVTVWFATGNNIEPVQDTVRRVLMVRIVVDTEKPQERTGFKRPMLVEYAEENRAEYLAAALTILRAYHCAGRPEQHLAPWGSFNRWSALVRGALVWAGCADPFQTQQRLQSDVSEVEHEANDFWIRMVELSDGSPGDIATKAAANDARSVLGLREEPNTHRVRWLIGRFVDKPRGGRRIRREGSRYWVEMI